MHNVRNVLFNPWIEIGTLTSSVYVIRSGISTYRFEQKEEEKNIEKTGRRMPEPEPACVCVCVKMSGIMFCSKEEHEL